MCWTSPTISQLPEDSFRGMSSLRTLNLVSNALTTLSTGVFSDLGALSDLNLVNNTLTTLTAGVFSKLSALKLLRLRSNSLTDLWSDVFAGLNNLILLDVSQNMLIDLPPGVFTGLSDLESLVLNYNKFHHLPPVLSDLTALTVLDVWEDSRCGVGYFASMSNATATACQTCVPGFSTNGQEGASACETARQGTIMRGSPPGNHDGIWTEYQGGCIFAGNYEGAPLVRAGSCPELEVLDFSYLGINKFEVYTGINQFPLTKEYAVVSRVITEAQRSTVEYYGNLYMTLDGTSPLDTNVSCQNYFLSLPSGWALAADNADSLNVIRSYRWGTHAMVVACGRAYGTLAFKEVPRSSPPPASEPLSPGSLWTTSGLSTSGTKYRSNGCNLRVLILKPVSARRPRGINQLPEDSFLGMSSLRTLKLCNNALTTLASGVFSGLSALSNLNLAGTGLTTLSADVFSNLSVLSDLNLGINNLTTLPAGVFSNLSALSALNLAGNALTTLPADQ
jgi:Leucine-rich repeat (LRR) protein